MEGLGIDWKVLVAQLVNFGILFYVLKRLLYKPLIKAIDDRNSKIENALVNSQKIEKKLKDFEAKEVELLAKARDKATAERKDILEIASKEKEGIIEEAKLVAQKEVEKGLENIKLQEKEAIQTLSDDYMDKIAAKLQKRLVENAKKEKFPIMRSLIKR